MDDTTYQAPFIEGRRRRSPKKRIIISSIIVFGIILLGIGVMQFMGQSENTVPEVTQEPTPTVVEFPTDTPTPSQQATPTGVLKTTPTKAAGKSADVTTGLDRKALRVIIQNGSGKAGAGSGASDVLKGLGYTIVSVGNADNFEYEDVTISVRSDRAAYVPLLKSDLSSDYTVGATNTTLPASGSADAIVIIGR